MGANRSGRRLRKKRETTKKHALIAEQRQKAGQTKTK